MISTALSRSDVLACGSTVNPINGKKGGTDMNSIFYIVGVVVVVIFVAGFFGLR
jgi:hypothetical protein